MNGSRLPELLVIHDLDGELSAGVCSHCKDVIAEAAPESKPTKAAILEFALAFQRHVQQKHPEED
jgi:hypothetical protein